MRIRDYPDRFATDGGQEIFFLLDFQCVGVSTQLLVARYKRPVFTANRVKNMIFIFARKKLECSGRNTDFIAAVDRQQLLRNNLRGTLEQLLLDQGGNFIGAVVGKDKIDPGDDQ